MEDTIAAIATAYGEGGIGIIRISGEDSRDILRKIFTGKIESRRLSYGKIMDENEHIDEVLAVYMKGPKTYTGEDVVEINCHGSMVALRKTLALVLSKGARMAEPGEFTKRAFLNGRLDLSQAEAVIDVIKAKSDRSFDVAMSQLEGSLSKRIEKIRQALLDLLVEVTVNIDYPDEDIEIMTYDKARDCLCNIRNMIGELLATSGSGRMIREGIRIAIVGKPNVGKSSLMNCLLRESRAIVTEIPGTTRDTIEEAVSIRNLPVYLIDTAGIRDTDDTVEKIGIEKTKEAFNNADYIILVVDGSRPLTSEDEEIISYVRGRRALVLLNKRDLGAEVTVDVISEKLPDCDIIEAALSKGEGLKEIEDNIESLVYGGQISQGESLMVNNVRHIDLLKHADSAAGDALSLLEIMEPLDIVEIDIRNAYDFLGEIVGDTVSDEIISEVFARFCLGK
ncbi:MAG: tRNA uridine-5-carboxymethylaminomethyl(34) synthesis GTPase MnmE [Lentihominibacter sp.]|nr:tRNA uridine-5-carboxymethylaminomethyl(34) synthesis GTPase MnmE [Lentihominibacter sp.]